MRNIPRVIIPLAVLTLLAAPGLLPGNPQQDTANLCVVSGRAVDSQTGQPLRKATVHLRFASRSPGTGRGSAPQGYVAVTDADGKFSFERIDPSEYFLSGERSGYLSTQYGAVNQRGPGKTLSLVSGQQLTNLSLVLTPQAVISGRVLDEDGDPVSGAMVQTVSQAWLRGKIRQLPSGSASSDDRGEFRIASLRPGKYFVFAQKQTGIARDEVPADTRRSDVRPVRTFYPDATSLQNAAPVQIRAGQDASGVDIRLRSVQTYHVRGRVLASGSGGGRLMVALSPADGVNAFFASRNAANRDGTFDIPGVGPGNYILSVFQGGPRQGLARVSVEVSASDVNDVSVPLSQPGTLVGHVTVEASAGGAAGRIDSPYPRIVLQASDQGYAFGPAPGAVPQADGTFTISNVPPGQYVVNVSSSPGGTYLKSIRFGQQEVLGKELDLTQGASGELEILFHYGAAEIDGTIQNRDTAESTPANANASATPSIVLVPETLNADGSGIRFSAPDQNGTFSIKQVPPGKYRAYAFEQVDGDQVQNPDVLKQLESKGIALELSENDRKQVQLPLIPSSETQQLFARMGIDSQ